MTREEIKKLLPLITAYTEGKEIEQKDTDGNWHYTSDLSFCRPPECYRIKQGPKYHPFESAKECWAEMQKHQPFGWIKFKNKNEDGYMHFKTVKDDGIFFYFLSFTFKEAFEYYVFIDGSPFGRKED